MLRKPAANAIAAIGSDVSSTIRFARCTRRVAATAEGGAPACSAKSRLRWRLVIPSVSARISHGLAVVEEAAVDQLARARHRRRGPAPRRRPRRGFGATAQARAEARALGGGRGRCAGLQAIAAALVVLGPGRPSARQTLRRRPA